MSQIKIGNNWYDKKGVRVPSPNGKAEKKKKEEEIKKQQLKLPLETPKPNKKPS